MGRAYRYQRRLTHIVLSVAERAKSADLVTKAEEPVVETKPAKKTAKPAAKKAAAKPAVEKKSAAPKKKASKKA